MSNSPIFIVGPPRTGTTLTARVLGNHSTIYISPVELFFFQRLYERRRALGQPDGSAQTTAQILQALREIAYKKRSERAYWQSLDQIFADPAFSECLNQARCYGEVLAYFMNAQASRAGKPRWGNQMPADLFALDHIFGFFPDARIIVCTRHPLDFLVSYRDMELRALRRNKPIKARRSRAYYHPVVTSILWNSCIRKARKAIELWPGQVLINRYEDLVQDPAAQVARLCAFLEEPFEPAMLEVKRNNSSRKVKSMGIYSSSVGQWRSELSPEVIHTCQTLCQSGMSYLGYEKAEVGAHPGSFCQHLLAAPLAFGRAMRAKSQFDQGGAPYMLKRLIS